MATLPYRAARAVFHVLPERQQQAVHTVLYRLRNPAALRRWWWQRTVFEPFDRGERERFFLQATGFLWTNRADSLRTGYYMEFGCFGAVTMRLAWKHTRHFFDLDYLAFDSFEGLPEIDPIDRQPIWKQGGLAMSEEDFRQRCRVPEDRLTTVKGFYDQSLTPELRDRLLPRKAAIIYIDCDLYRSTVPVLDFIAPFLQTGTVLAFDDWNCFWADPDRGQRRAWREFLESHHDLRFEPFVSTHGLRSFICMG